MRKFVVMFVLALSLVCTAVASATSTGYRSNTASATPSNVYGIRSYVGPDVTWTMASNDSVQALVRVQNGSGTGFIEGGMIDTGSSWNQACETTTRKFWWRWRIAGDAGTLCVLSLHDPPTNDVLELITIRRCNLPSTTSWCGYIGGVLDWGPRDVNFSNAGAQGQYQGTTRIGLRTTLSNPSGTMSSTDYLQYEITNETGSSPTWTHYTPGSSDQCVENAGLDFHVPTFALPPTIMDFFSDSSGTPDTC